MIFSKDGYPKNEKTDHRAQDAARYRNGHEIGLNDGDAWRYAGRRFREKLRSYAPGKTEETKNEHNGKTESNGHLPDPIQKIPGNTPKKTRNDSKIKFGRPPLVEGRSEKITVWIRPEVKKRLKRALLQEKLIRDETRSRISISLYWWRKRLMDWIKARTTEPSRLVLF